MKVYEMLSFNKELLLKIHTAGLRVEDYKYVDLYAEYLQLKRASEKVTYIVHYLSDKYKISERQVYSIIGRMQQDITTANPVQLETV
ncbi:MAG: hypothetical protein SNG69_04425 [Rikenellaceae bacterium]